MNDAKTAQATAKPATQQALLVVINGESNSGGCAPNSQALPSEIGPRPSVQILNNETLASFEELNIGVNNLVGHAGLISRVNHGFELELANRAAANPFYRAPCYLVKTGQGGSRIDQWAVAGDYYKTFAARIAAAKKLLRGQDYRTVILFSLGINDAIAGTDLAIWKPAVKEHFVNLRRELGAEVPIVMTRFMPRYAAYNQAIEELCKDIPNTYSVNTLDAALEDDNHWNYQGMKQVTGRMLDVVEGLRN
jgi:hypothetical protein